VSVRASPGSARSGSYERLEYPRRTNVNRTSMASPAARRPREWRHMFWHSPLCTHVANH
jgi:hypothetical protein